MVLLLANAKGQYTIWDNTTNVEVTAPSLLTEACDLGHSF